MLSAKEKSKGIEISLAKINAQLFQQRLSHKSVRATFSRKLFLVCKTTFLDTAVYFLFFEDQWNFNWILRPYELEVDLQRDAKF